MHISACLFERVLRSVPAPVHAAASGVHWKSGKDVTVKVMKKKAKPGSKGGGKPQTKTEPLESFFRWFTEVPEVSSN